MPRGSNTYGADGNIIIGTTVDMGGMNTGLSRIQKSFKKLAYLSGGALGIAGLVKFGKSAIDAASDLQEVQNIVDVAFGNMEYKVEKFASTCIEKFGMSELAAKQTAGSFMAMGNSIGLSMEDASNMAIQLTSLTGDMASFYNISQDYARVALSAVYTGETETLKRYGIILTEANLQEYAATQNITKKVKAMSAAEKVALRYNYVMQATSDMQGDFARTSGNWANQVRVLQQRWNQFLIVLGSGIITVLTPLVKILNQVIAALIRFAQIIGSILQNIFGFKFQSLTEQNNAIASSAGAAADAEDDLADATKAAGKAAKRGTSAFDKLNEIHSKTSSGSSGGGAGGGGDFSVPDITEGDSIIDKMKDTLLSDIDSLYGLGKYISDTLRNMLLSIDWDSIYEGARNFGTGLAQFLNGLFQPETFYVVGQTIANALNTAIYAALAFAEEFDFANFGNALAQAVNGFFENFDFAALADTIDAWVQGIYEAIVSFIQNVNWSEVFKGIGEFLTNLDVDTIEIIVGALVIKKIGSFIFGGELATIISAALMPHIEQGIILALEGIASGGGLQGAVRGLFAGLFGTEALAPITAIATTIAGIAVAISGVVLVVVNFVDMWKEGFSWINEIFLLLGSVLITIGLIVAGVAALPAIIIGGIVAAVATLAVIIHDHWEEIKSWFAGIGEWVDTNIFQPVSECVANIIEKVKEIWDNITSTIGQIVGWLKTNIIDPIVEKVTFVVTFIGQIVESIWIIIKAMFILLWNFFYNNVIQPIINKVTSLWNFIKGIINTAWQAIKKFFITIYNNWMNVVIKPVINKAKYLWNTIKTGLNTLWNWAKGVLGKIANWVDVHVVQPVAGFFKWLWDSITSGIKGAINTAIGAIESFINHVIDAINAFTSGLSAVAGAASKITGDDYSGIFTLNHVSLPRLAKGAVIPPNKEFMAILGDQKHGTNIEAPLDTIVDAFNKAGGKSSENELQLLRRQNELLEQILYKGLQISSRDLFNSVRSEAKDYYARTGNEAFI